MDYQTAAALCLVDLAPLIEAGEFRDFHLAEGIIEAAVSAVSTERHRAFMLYRLANELCSFMAPDRPECDAYLRAVRSAVRYQQRKRFERRLTALSAGA